MHNARPLLVALLLCLGLVPAAAAQSGSPSPATAIKDLLQRQTADWNRGNLEAFATGYKNAPDILFVGPTLERGYDQMLRGYKAHYPNRAAMGTLSFSDLAVQPMDERFATATGHFHLQRAAASGGNVNGYFLLVLENTSNGWKIIRDDTAATPAGK